MKFYCYNSKNLLLEKENVFKHIKRNYVFYISFSMLVSLLTLYLSKSLYIPDIPIKEVVLLKDKSDHKLYLESMENFNESNNK